MRSFYLIKNPSVKSRSSPLCSTILYFSLLSLLFLLRVHGWCLLSTDCRLWIGLRVSWGLLIRHGPLRWHPNFFSWRTFLRSRPRRKFSPWGTSLTFPNPGFCTPRTTRRILSTTPPIPIMVSSVSVYRRASSSVDSDSPSYLWEEAPETDADSTRSISLEQFSLHQLISTQVSTTWDRASTSSFLELVRL